MLAGVKFEDLSVLLAPGGSKNDPKAAVIGIFGVGSKRASIALGEHVEVKTRFRGERSLESGSKVMKPVRFGVRGA
jgi:hypothetical protein